MFAAWIDNLWSSPRLVVAAFVAIDFKIYVALGLGLTRQLVPVLGSTTTKATTIIVLFQVLDTLLLLLQLLLLLLLLLLVLCNYKSFMYFVECEDLSLEMDMRERNRINTNKSKAK